MLPTKVMIVEDNSIVAENCRDNLENLGYHVTSILASGEEAIESASVEKPDLVLMDIQLRGEMDGIEAADQIYSLLNIPVVFLTAYSDDELLERAGTTGSFGYLVKPFEARELHATLEIALNKARMQQEERQLNEILEEKVNERTTELTEANIALKVLFKQNEESRQEMEKQTFTNYKMLIMPYLEDLKKALTTTNQHSLLSAVESELDNIMSPFTKNLSDPLLNLSPVEVKVAGLIRSNKTTKEIAKILNNSEHTICHHRDNIRRKLNIKNKKVNLKMYLATL